VFYRNSGFSTAYVGSSNLTRPAISSGLEWNVKLTERDQAETIKKIDATFESYWNSSEFVKYDESQEMRLASALKAERIGQHLKTINPVYSFDIRPYPYQQEILDALEAERSVRESFRNLIVAATGTGKTVISAFDYKRYIKTHPGSACRLLFVAHREEILKQSMDCFRGVLKDMNFGDLFVSSFRP
jgi:superfamily II DNA or RNA helicase